MPPATLASKGQLTLPRRVREHLGVQSGDAIDFITGPGGEVRIKAGEGDVSELEGLLRDRLTRCRRAR